MMQTSLKIICKSSKKPITYQNHLEKTIRVQNISKRDMIHQSNGLKSNNHAVISNGPFYLESYSPESRTIKVSAFEDDSYPFKKGDMERL